jgi:hypothetical protein
MSSHNTQTLSKKRNPLEYWYDKHHTGALRIIDHANKVIYGSDPKELEWKVVFEPIQPNTILVNFHSKKTHYGKVFLNASYQVPARCSAMPYNVSDYLTSFAPGTGDKKSSGATPSHLLAG